MQMERAQIPSKVSQELRYLIRNLTAVDKSTFDRRIIKALQPFFRKYKITWLTPENSPERFNEEQSKSIQLYDSLGKVVALVVLEKGRSTLNSDECLKALPLEWPILMHLLPSLYVCSQRLTEAKELAFIDDVTQLYNQRYLKLVLDKEILRAQRSNIPLSALFIDIDHFKMVNDERGHLAGSMLLCQMSNILRQNIRSIDYGFRYGGDEFILLLIGAGKDHALAVGERIRKEVEKNVFSVEGCDVNLTLSIGVASFPEHAKTKEDIIRMADEAMYEGKNRSRNIVSVAS